MGDVSPPYSAWGGCSWSRWGGVGSPPLPRSLATGTAGLQRQRTLMRVARGSYQKGPDIWRSHKLLYCQLQCTAFYSHITVSWKPIVQ